MKLIGAIFCIVVISLAIIHLSGFDQRLFSLLNPARDLTGTWKSSILGEGLVLEPKYNPPHRFHYDVKLELAQTGNEVTGSLWTMLWKVDQLDPNNPYPSFDYVWSPSYPVSGQISSSSIEFKVTIPDMTLTFEGSFTTDLMSGQVKGYQPSLEMWYVGEFHLIKR